MFTIRGETEIPVLELDHLEGYRGSKPVRIGNGTALGFHQQFDMYSDLMDAIYLNNKYGKPMTWDTWVSGRSLLGTFFNVGPGLSTGQFGIIVSKLLTTVRGQLV